MGGDGIAGNEHLGYLTFETTLHLFSWYNRTRSCSKSSTNASPTRNESKPCATPSEIVMNRSFVPMRLKASILKSRPFSNRALGQIYTWNRGLLDSHLYDERGFPSVSLCSLMNLSCESWGLSCLGPHRKHPPPPTLNPHRIGILPLSLHRRLHDALYAATVETPTRPYHSRRY